MKKLKSLLLVCCLAVAGISLSGCIAHDTYRFVRPDGEPSDKNIAKVYHLTQLRKSTAADVLPLIFDPDHSLMSQSTTILASHGTKKGGDKQWLNLVSFDENDLLAKRKYLMIVDEAPKILFTERWAGQRFDCEIIAEGEVLEEPYADENARLIAILKYAKQMIHDDLMDVRGDNKAYEVAGAMINQSLEEALQDLDKSPALAAKLPEEKGLGFEHLSFGKGKIRLRTNGNLVSVKLRAGSYTKNWKKEDDTDYDDD